MICVHCSESMLALEFGDLEIDYCDSCGGIWLDSGEMELALGEENFREDQLVPLAAGSQSRRSKRDCPICSKRMELVALPDHTTELDRCVRGHGIWFDRGELRQVAGAILVEGSEQITKLLAEFFEE